MEEQEVQRVRRRPWLRGWRIVAAAAMVLVVAAFLVIWSMRVQLATDYIDREFARRDVRASYDVKRIGFGTQVFENLVIGDPRRPDLMAREVRVRLLFGLTGPRVGLITARGVRMYGRIVDGRLTLGDVDRLLPPPSGLPFRLPDQRIDLTDAAIVLDTPAGRLALALAGRGNLADGFRGRLAAVSRGLRLGDCVVSAPTADVVVAVRDLRPTFRGPIAFQSAGCGTAFAVERSSAELDVTLTPAFDAWRGGGRLAAGRVQAGPNLIAGARGRLTFAGDAAATQGRVRLESAAARLSELQSARTDFAGAYRLSARDGELALTGILRAHRLVARPEALAPVAETLRSMRGTPLGPIGRQLADALVRAGRGGAEARARLRLASGGGRGGVELRDVRLESRSGAVLTVSGGNGIAYRWPTGSLGLDGDLALSGGGLPDARFALRQPRSGGPLEGVGRIAPIVAGRARLALQEIRFVSGADGRTRFATALRLDGPLSGGGVTGLTLPVRGRFGRGAFAVGEGCVTASFRTLQVERLRIGPSRMPICPTGPALVWKERSGPLRAGAELRGPRFAGRLGGSPIALTSNRIRVDLDGFAASGVAARLGEQPWINRLDVASLDARFVSRGVSGSFTGLSGQIAGVPLLMSEGAGRWQVVRGDLMLQGRLVVADEMSPARFYPLVTDDLRLTLVDSRLRATGWLSHPQTGTRVTRADVVHDLRTGAGLALLDVPGLTFTPDFQPEALTRLTVGVVALVDGTLRGQGRIEWDARGTRSSGTFATAGMNLAAPFGPVEGLTTRIEFTDLLGLVSAPGQVAEIDLVRAGIDVYDGTLVYQLRPNYHVAIERGRWPYAGGELILQPTVLDFSRSSTKYLTFRVVGIDAARFVQLMEFSNIAATGTFDGIVPMQFDIRGGRIVGGRLEARPSGGTLSYIGELTDRDLGVYGKMAFDALKELRYNRFEMTLDGSLEGEFVTFIDLDGVARNPTAPLRAPGGAIGQIIAGRALRQLARVPFEFNIRIQGPFRALLATARSFNDPTLLIQPVLPRLLRDRPTTVSDVQDEESENER